MIDPARDEVMEAKSVIKSVQVLTRELGGRRETRESRLILLFRPNDKMAETIYTLKRNANCGDVSGGRADVGEGSI
jgi:hypothetical protein